MTIPANSIEDLPGTAELLKGWKYYPPDDDNRDAEYWIELYLVSIDTYSVFYRECIDEDTEEQTCRMDSVSIAAAEIYIHNKQAKLLREGYTAGIMIDHALIRAKAWAQRKLPPEQEHQCLQTIWLFAQKTILQTS